MADLETRRTRAVTLLSGAFAEDRIDQVELERRLELAEQAETTAQLDALLADLGPSAAAEALVVAPVGVELVPADQVPAEGRSVCILGSVHRQGAWTPARHHQVLAVLGDNRIDLRGARLGAGVTTLEVQAVLGSVHITVPPGLAVEVDCTPILGGVELDPAVQAREAASEGPRLRIQGTAILGSIEIRERLPGESTRQAKRRWEDAARQLGPGGERRQLGDGRSS